LSAASAVYTLSGATALRNQERGISMVNIERTRTFELTPAEIWEVIGDFHGLHTWHPGIADSTPSEDGTVRTLTLAGEGGTVIETRTGEGPLHHSYRIDESPFPIRDHGAMLMVREADGGTEVVWSAEFEVDEITEDEGMEMMHTFIDAGFDSIQAS
jgi:mxaD protein